MAEVQRYTATPRKPQWRDLSHRHHEARQELENALERFSQGNGAPAKNIVGPYGSGKSELMAWGFHYTWTRRHFPAIYITLETLLRHLPERMGPSDLVTEINEFLQEQLSGIERALESQPRPDGIYLATDIRPDESFADYFHVLFGEEHSDLSAVRRALAKNRTALFVDEIEQKYGELVERVETSDQAPLREMLQGVEQGLVPFYLVLSFGLTSAYEAISGADARRIDTITLPIPDAGELGELSQIVEYENFMWWASRGRPGWAVKLAQNWGHSLSALSRLEQFHEFAVDTIENMPLIDTNTIRSAFASRDASTVMAGLIKTISPVPADHLSPADEHQISVTLDSLPPYCFLVVTKEERLLQIEDFADAFMKDLSTQADDLEATGVDWQQIRYYVLKIVSAMADSENRIVFGGWLDKTKYFAEAAIGPLLILLQDMILEFEGDRTSAATVLSFLDRVMERCTIVNDRVEQPHQVIGRFNQTSRLFKEVYEFDSQGFISLSPKAIEGMFPRMVARPLLMLHQHARSTMVEQQVALTAAVSESGHFIEAKRRHNGISIRIIFIPSSETVPTLQENYLSRQQRHIYLNRDLVYVVLPLIEQDDYSLDIGLNSDIELLQNLCKLSWRSLGEKRVQDFVSSLWHNWITKPGHDRSVSDLFEILDEFLNDPALSKSNRRKFEYYRNRLEHRIDDISVSAYRTFNRELDKLFDPEEEVFPDKRIRDALDHIRENRSIEQVVLAFDVVKHRSKTLETLYQLRQLDQLMQATKQPNAYKEFLEGYAAIRRVGKDMEPAASLADIASYVSKHNGFVRLLSVARHLGLDPRSDWNVSQEGTHNAPLLWLYDGCTDTQAIFIQGLSLYSYLADNRGWLLNELNDLLDTTEGLINDLEKLKKEVERLNSQLGEEILLTTDIEMLQYEVNELHTLLKSAPELPPSALYVLFRFSDSSLNVVEETRQRWSSEHGIQGWKNRFDTMLNWRERIGDLTGQLEVAYRYNTAIKEDMLGTAEANASHIRDDLEKAATKVLTSIDKANQLSDENLPDRDITSVYTEALSEAHNYLADTLDQAEAIDTILATLDELKSEVEDFIGELGE